MEALLLLFEPAASMDGHACMKRNKLYAQVPALLLENTKKVPIEDVDTAIVLR